MESVFDTLEREVEVNIDRALQGQPPSSSVLVSKHFKVSICQLLYLKIYLLLTNLKKLFETLI